MAKKPNFYPVILAGGSGTRFWPRSRKKMAKQVLALDGKQTMIQQTVDRLLPLTDKKRFWVITNGNLYLFAGERGAQNFKSNAEANASKAAANWKTLKTTATQ